jgi:hypothetical protein
VGITLPQGREEEQREQEEEETKQNITQHESKSKQIKTNTKQRRGTRVR